MAEKVEIDYDSLDAIETSFAVEAEKVLELLHKVKSSADNLHGGLWIGKGADAFYVVMYDDMLPAVQRLAEALREGEHVIGEITMKFLAAEEDLKNVWKP